MTSRLTMIHRDDSDDEHAEGEWSDEYLCWQCVSCNTINNLGISITKYKAICYNCDSEIYIAGLTKVSHKFKWDAPKKKKHAITHLKRQLLKEKIFKRHKIWLCQICTFHNKINSLQCQICQNKRTTKSIKSGWKCYNCSFTHSETEKSLTECKQCKYRVPIKFNWKLYQANSKLLICGYCNRIKKMPQFKFINIPTYISDIIHAYYVWIKKSQLGTITKNTDAIYLWKYKIVSTDNISSNKPLNISLGVVAINDEDGKDIWKYCLNEKIRKLMKYCQPFKCNDVITMELNYIDETLSFGINDHWYGCLGYIDKNKQYKTEIQIFNRNIKMNMINLTIIPQGLEDIIISEEDRIKQLKNAIISKLNPNVEMAIQSVLNTDDDTYLSLTLDCLKFQQKKL